MSVPASDFAQAGQGVSGVATPEMNPAQATGMPTAQEMTAPSFEQLPDVAAPQEEAPPVDLDTLPENVRSYLDNHYRSTIEGQLRAKYDEDFNNLRSTKDQELNTERQRLAALQSNFEVSKGSLNEAIKWAAAYIAEVAEGKREADPRDVLVLTQSIQGKQAQAVQTRQQAIQSFQAFRASQDSAHEQYIASQAQGADGLPPVPVDSVKADPQVQSLYAEMLRLMDAEAQSNFSGAYTAQGRQVQAQLQQAINTAIQRARIQAVAQPVIQNQQVVNQNLQRQADRGPQPQGAGMSALTGTVTMEDRIAAKSAEMRSTHPHLFNPDGRPTPAGYAEIFDAAWE